MPYIKIKGIKGKLFVPEQKKEDRKYHCKDCNYCIWCSNAKCNLCLNRKCKKKG